MYITIWPLMCGCMGGGYWLVLVIDLTLQGTHIMLMLLVRCVAAVVVLGQQLVPQLLGCCY